MENKTASDNRYRLNIDQIQKFLPHRAPFLLVDRVLEIHPTGDLNDLSPNGKVGTRVVAIKNVTFNEPYMPGHFPGFAIMPGVLITEVMAQAASFSVYPYIERDLERLAGTFQTILVGIENARFRRPVTPGDTLRIETEVTKSRGRLWMFKCQVTVDGQKVAEAELMANLVSTADNHKEGGA